jgi:phospholipid-binding lipoprotein MlaA
VKIVSWICSLSVFCLISLHGPCIAENSTRSPSFEAPVSIPSPEETLPAPGTVESLEPSNAVEPSTSLDPTETFTSLEQDDGAVEAPTEDSPPEPSPSEASAETIADPLEPVNRVFFHFNDKLYFWVLKPVATGYETIIPEDGRVGVRNFFSNFTTPIRLVNCLLQARFKGAGNETMCFFINTTYGIVGFLDTAKKEFKIEKQEADFGQTLGVWGMGPAFYINWPILGPSTLRETVGYVGDASLDARTYLPSRFLIVNMSAWVLDKVNETSLTLGEYESLKKAALDPYIAVKEAYYQYRQNKIKR